MSWDVILFKEKSDSLSSKKSVETIGSKTQIIQTLTTLFPSINIPDPDWGWGELQGEKFYIEFNLGFSDDFIEVITLHVRGGTEAIKIIQTICNHTGWQALDTETGDFINFEN